MGRLDDKVAIVTGAGSGIGRAASILFAKEGAKIVVADLAVDGGQETIRTIREMGGQAIFVRTDVSKASDVIRMVEAAIDAYGKLNILFNNAGVTEREGGSITACSEEIFDRTIAINLKGVFFGMKYAIPEMLRAGGGSIINNASAAAVQPLVGIPAYTASKGGVITLSREIAMEYLTKNIRVNYINPGATRTPMNTLVEGRMRQQVPSGRMIEPEEIAQVALFLASDESSSVTATGVNADQGLTAQTGLDLF